MKPLSLISSDQNQIYGFCQVGTSGTVTEFIVRKLKKFFCEMYEKKPKKQRIQINQLKKLGITYTASGTEEYYLQCYYHGRMF